MREPPVHLYRLVNRKHAAPFSSLPDPAQSPTLSSCDQVKLLARHSQVGRRYVESIQMVAIPDAVPCSQEVRDVGRSELERTVAWWSGDGIHPMSHSRYWRP